MITLPKASRIESSGSARRSWWTLKACVWFDGRLRRVTAGQMPAIHRGATAAFENQGVDPAVNGDGCRLCVPARNGTKAWCRPRARGGEPRLQVAGASDYDVVPAHAGVNRAATGSA